MSYINRDYNGTDLRLPLVNVVILSNSPHYKTLSHLASVTEKWLRRINLRGHFGSRGLKLFIYTVLYAPTHNLQI